MLEYLRCNICDNSNFRILYSFSYGKHGVRKVVQCRNCGLVLCNPMPDAVSLADLYEDNYYYFSGELFESYVGKAVADWERTNISEYSCGRLLEIGCAYGALLYLAREEGWDAYGVEVSTLASAFAREELQLNVLSGSLEDATFEDDFFDVIVALDLIEHVRDPKRFLLECKRKLKHRGVLILDTPNIGSLFYKVVRKYWLGFNPYHLYYFCPRTLGMLLASAGFQIERITTHSVKVFSFDMIRRLGIAGFLESLGIREWAKRTLHAIKRKVATPTPFLLQPSLSGLKMALEIAGSVTQARDVSQLSWFSKIIVPRLLGDNLTVWAREV